ncbi:MAG TPA: precorrin-6y C5,15-methyltransferase (decarboxylating) subunit CbiE, partial [Dissulfurispiraceae bacterium]|nr:precorrin-6y C5,15-methyltransferase (decarboxylating) subunit CbiE [Dissulfurispiraceae bacterium]
IVLGSDVIVASKRLLDVFQGYEEFEVVRDKVSVLNNINETIEFIRNNYKTKKIALIASGDPMFSGIGRRAVDEFGKDAVEIIPDLSSIQIAFSRIKEPWDDAFLISLHGGPDPAKRRRLPYEIQEIPFLVERHNKIAILTDRENNPAEIARILSLSPIAHGLSPMLYVCEKLGYADEKITVGSPEDIAGKFFSDPNVAIILSSKPIAPGSKPSAITFGLMEDEISHSRGLITKDEIRSVTIHKLRLPQSGVFWDIGSGSGSIAIEAARLFPGLRVFAIEKNNEQIQNIKKNKTMFEASNIEIVEGVAPDVLKELPSPDRVFIGGSGGQLEEIISLLTKQMFSGVAVINATKIETLAKAIAEMQKAGFRVDISQVSVSRTKAVHNGNYLSALNPVFIVKGEARRQL